uniref:Coiled-coil domain-containing protein 180 n=1 Tax=Angiostrongylus cantonensis TaxID=6313 RepID=A0A158P854_ANGCA
MASNITFYTDRLAQKEQELNELQAAFYKCKLKTKVKLDQLRKEVLSFCNDHGYSINENEASVWKTNHALLLIRVAENEAMLEASCRETEFLRNEMSRKQKQLNDQLILIKNLEEQLRASQPLSPLEIQERKRAAQMIDIDRIHQQIMFKELCREQGEVASVTSQAARIVHKQWEENWSDISLKGWALKNRNRERRDVATETDTWLWNPVQPLQRELEPRARGDSPGRAVATRGSANTSPPPLDPSEVLERTGKCEENDDIPFPGSSNSLGKSPELDLSFRKKNRKRVTFDLLSDSQEHPPRIALDEHFTNVALELSSENERLQNELVEVTTSLEQLRERINEVRISPRSSAELIVCLRQRSESVSKLHVPKQTRKTVVLQKKKKRKAVRYGQLSINLTCPQ